MINIDQIKRSGFFLGLESELSRQQQILVRNIKDQKWTYAKTSAQHIEQILDEIVTLTTSTLPVDAIPNTLQHNEPTNPPCNT